MMPIHKLDPTKGGTYPALAAICAPPCTEGLCELEYVTVLIHAPM